MLCVREIAVHCFAKESDNFLSTQLTRLADPSNTTSANSRSFPRRHYLLPLVIDQSWLSNCFQLTHLPADHRAIRIISRPDHTSYFASTRWQTPEIWPLSIWKMEHPDQVVRHGLPDLHNRLRVVSCVQAGNELDYELRASDPPWLPLDRNDRLVRQGSQEVRSPNSGAGLRRGNTEINVCVLWISV